MGPSVEGILITYSYCSRLLNKMATIIIIMPIIKIIIIIIIENLKILLFQNQESFKAEASYIASFTQDLSNLFR